MPSSLENSLGSKLNLNAVANLGSLRIEDRK